MHLRYQYLSRLGLAEATIYGKGWKWAGRSLEERADMWDLESMAIGWGKGAGKRGVQVYSAVNIAGYGF